MTSSIPFSTLYSPSLALLTDFYQLTMACGYWKGGLAEKEAVFHLIFRRNPFGGGFSVAAGLENAIAHIQSLRFDESDIDYLKEQRGSEGETLFPDDFLEYLRNFKPQIHVDAMPEGTVVFPQEPLIRVQGPLIHCQLLESSLLNLINFSTLIATKAARLRIAAKDDHILEFGLRRAQGIDGALTASRAAYIGGCDATSNVLAGKLFGIPVKGTHSHSWVMAFESETESFETFAKAFPDNTVFLVDTYNTLQGVNKAIEVGKKMRQEGFEMLGIRLDSGDLAYFSIQSRKMLDDAGFPKAKIFASNELDETVLMELKRQGAQIAVWGVGTNLVTAKDQPALDGVYKLSSIRDPSGPWEDRLKLSEQMLKVSTPGILQVRRYFDGQENVADMIYDTKLGTPIPPSIVDPLDATREKEMGSDLEHKDLLVPIFRDGKCVYDLPSLLEIRAFASQEIVRLHRGVKRFLNPHQYIVGMEKGAYENKVGQIKKIRTKIKKREDASTPHC